MKKTFPGLIDVHVHLRDPGAIHKEDFATGSRSAVAGGFTFILDMPNNPQPTVTLEALDNKRKLVNQKAICPVGFHFGTNGLNIDQFAKAASQPDVFGLKLYCNHTTGEMLLEDIELLTGVFANWHSDKPILVHAEGKELAAAIGLARLYDRHLHVCHISQAIEVELVRQAKKTKQKISAGVTPHHLSLTNEDFVKNGAWNQMKPPLGTQADQDALWEGVGDGTIDLVETDHAPHTQEEKKSANPPYGVPGLETAVSLTLLGLRKHGISEKLLKKLLYSSPKKLFSIPDQPDTSVGVDLDRTWIVGDQPYQTKCGWSPFVGWELPGVVTDVKIAGRVLVAAGKLVI